jgi:hypothetical protein
MQGCFLPNHLDRILVFADPEKEGLPEPIIACPFREFVLADQDWLDPAAPLHFSSAQPGSKFPRPGAGRLKKGQVSNCT